MSRIKYYNPNTDRWEYADSQYTTGGNVDLTGVVKSVNGKIPDEDGNVYLYIPEDIGDSTLYVNIDANNTSDLGYGDIYSARIEGKIVFTYYKEVLFLFGSYDFIKQTVYFYPEDTSIGYRLALKDKTVTEEPIESNVEDGFSPIVTVTETEDGAVISVTDKEGTTTATITNGKDGKDGADGKDGTSATHSWNGTVLTITSASGTSSADLKGAKGDKGDKGDTGERGIQGEPGATGAAGKDGVDGKDYVLTDGDRAEIAAMVIEMLGGEPVFGYVDENGNIIVQGNLPDGTYSVKYEIEDGSTIDIGDLVLDSNVYYSVTNQLTNCTNSNSATEITGGQSYSAVITANSGYELSSVTVTMGGEPVSVSGGTVSIANVTGDIVITAVAAEKTVSEPVTQSITLSDGVRLGSDGTDRSQAGYCATPYIELTDIPKPCTIHLTKAKWGNSTTTDSGYCYCYATDAAGTKLNDGMRTLETSGNGHFTVVKNGGKNTDLTVTVTSESVARIRFSGQWASSEVRDDWGLEKWDSVMQAEATLTYTPES